MPGRVVCLGVLLVNFSEIISSGPGWFGLALVRVSARSGAFCLCILLYFVTFVNICILYKDLLVLFFFIMGLVVS